MIGTKNSPGLASAFQSFLLGAGHPTAVGHWTRSFPYPTRQTSTSILNKAGRKVWREDGPTAGQCVWEMHGVWGWDNQKNSGVVLREHYFRKHPLTGKEVFRLLSTLFAHNSFHVLRSIGTWTFIIPSSVNGPNTYEWSRTTTRSSSSKLFPMK
jgi:hypothetical protein